MHQCISCSCAEEDCVIDDGRNPAGAKGRPVEGGARIEWQPIVDHIIDDLSKSQPSSEEKSWQRALSPLKAILSFTLGDDLQW